MECTDPMKIESKIKNEFRTQFKLISGTEFFEGYELLMLETFNKIIIEHQKSENTTIPISCDIVNSVTNTIINNDTDNSEVLSCNKQNKDKTGVCEHCNVRTYCYKKYKTKQRESYIKNELDI